MISVRGKLVLTLALAAVLAAPSATTAFAETAATVTPAPPAHEAVRQEAGTLPERIPDAVDRLVAETDAHGVRPGVDFTRDWQLLREVRERHPNSFLARGMAAYEEVRGAPYLEIDRRRPADDWPYRYGDGQYDPQREIPGWERYLKTYSSHPGADDAAYRLGRCYEIKGDYPAALNALYRATLLPDGDCHDDAAGRIVYLLDAVMTREQLASLAADKLEPHLVPLVEYSMAVKTLRRDDFRAAAEALTGFLARHPEPWTPMSRNPEGRYDLAAAIGKQADTARRLADLQARWEQTRDPQALYDLAAAVYHDTLTYYNHPVGRPARRVPVGQQSGIGLAERPAGATAALPAGNDQLLPRARIV